MEQWSPYFKWWCKLFYSPLGFTHAFEMQFIVYLDTALGFNKSFKGIESSVHEYNFCRVTNTRILQLNNWVFFFFFAKFCFFPDFWSSTYKQIPAQSTKPNTIFNTHLLYGDHHGDYRAVLSHSVTTINTGS